MGSQSTIQLNKLRHELRLERWFLWGIRCNFVGVRAKLAVLELDTEPFGGRPLPALFSILRGKVNES